MTPPYQRDADAEWWSLVGGIAVGLGLAALLHAAAIHRTGWFALVGGLGAGLLCGRVALAIYRKLND